MGCQVQIGSESAWSVRQHDRDSRGWVNSFSSPIKLVESNLFENLQLYAEQEWKREK